MTAIVVRDRRKGLLLLAGSLFDLLHEPETSTGAMLRKQLAVREDVPDRLEPCHRCGGSWAQGPDTRIRYGVNPGSGLVKSRYRRGRTCPGDGTRSEDGEPVPCPGVCEHCGDPCEDCGGYLEATAGGPVKRPGTGLIAVDSHIDVRHRRALSSDEAGTKPGRVETWLCNICAGAGVEPKKRGLAGERIPCRACGGTGQREHAPFELRLKDAQAGDPATVVERAIEHRDQEGSFHELDLCLAVLRRQAAHRHRVFWDVHVLGTRDQVGLAEHEARWLEEATTDLLRMMPATLKVPWSVLHAEKARWEQLRDVRGNGADPRARAHRDGEIRRAFATGEQTLPQLVRTTGLSRSRLSAIVYGGP